MSPPNCSVSPGSIRRYPRPFREPQAGLALRRARRFLIVPGSIMLCIAIWLTHGKESSR